MDSKLSISSCSIDKKLFDLSCSILENKNEYYKGQLNECTSKYIVFLPLSMSSWYACIDMISDSIYSKISSNKIKNNESIEYESDFPERLKEIPKRLVVSKKLTVPERLAASRNKENDDNDDKVDKDNEVYEANEVYETDKGDEYHNEIINIDKNEEE
ncbi:hypothetical protein Glove_149g130 [Diversispora epigaea]|uniref:Uncharacterized protein n=1 Tax=Diversispora epigaea TaxID=1348612 RepID=A0A397ITJ9_9GLOM|nr:hypothetical protein Glove_149g130 [Diversispora epigaea]